MSTFAEIYTNVLLVVPTPERETLIKTKINQMIRYISSSGTFWRDIDETTIGSADGVDATELIQSIPITTSIRSMIYCKYPTTIVGPNISLVDIEGILHQCDAFTDAVYLAGGSMHIKHSVLTSTFDIGYYTNPAFFAVDGADDDSSNWITELVPGLVEDMTTAYLLNIIGEKEDAKRIQELSAVFQGTYIRDFVTSVASGSA